MIGNCRKTLLLIDDECHDSDEQSDRKRLMSQIGQQSNRETKNSLPNQSQ
ncbi:hypothetical protein BVRB_9g205560 [Beta vulgaris subsp. vulgaris]|nr:hypothetical protein BVRB_9g205560 [Beta vulgaris subsp. vulgaris]